MFAPCATASGSPSSTRRLTFGLKPPTRTETVSPPESVVCVNSLLGRKDRLPDGVPDSDLDSSERLGESEAIVLGKEVAMRMEEVLDGKTLSLGVIALGVPERVSGSVDERVSDEVNEAALERSTVGGPERITLGVNVTVGSSEGLIEGAPEETKKGVMLGVKVDASKYDIEEILEEVSVALLLSVTVGDPEEEEEKVIEAVSEGVGVSEEVIDGVFEGNGDSVAVSDPEEVIEGEFEGRAESVTVDESDKVTERVSE